MGMDLLPTFMELANINIPAQRKLDGVSFRSLLFNGDGLPERPVFFGYEPKLGTAMRDGKWKMIVKANKIELYDLSKDIGEKTNVAVKYSERAKEMKTAIDAWKKDVTWKSQEHSQ